MAGQECRFLDLKLSSYARASLDMPTALSLREKGIIPNTLAMISFEKPEEAVFHLKNLQNAGVKIIELNSAQYGRWKNSSLFLVDEYYKEMTKIGVDGKKILEEYEKLYRKYERKK